jgi:hypothetical protein
MTITNNTKISIRNTRTGVVTTLLETDLGAENRVTGKVVAGIPFTDTIDDSLDSFVVQLKDLAQRDLFKPFDFVVFRINDGVQAQTIEKRYFVLFDNVQTYSQAKNTYVHNLTLVEPTKILEKIKIFNINLTNPNDTFGMQVNKAIWNAEPIFYNLDYDYSDSGNPIYKKDTRIFCNTRLSIFIVDKASRDFYFSNTDLRSVLDEMLGAYNARITVEDVLYDNATGDISEITLGYRDMTAITEITPIWTKEEQGEIIFEQAENDGQNYAGTIVARGNNSIGEEPIRVIDTFKSENAVLNTDNATIILPFPISDKGIKSLKLKNLKLSYIEVGATLGTTPLVVDIDISQYIIPMEQYELLDATQNRTYIPYTIGSNKIYFGKTWSKWWGEKIPTIASMLANSIKDKSIIVDGVEYVPSIDIAGEIEALNYLNYPVECVYYPLINTVASVSKPNVYDKDDLLMGIMDSQTEQTLDIDRHGKKLSGLIKRTGNAEYYMDVKAKYYSKLLPLMSKINLPDADSEEEQGYVLYKREYSIFDNFINCRYYFSKDFNAVQQNAGVNREKHLFDIPLESSETPIVVKKYLVFSTEQQLKGGFDKSLCVSALNTLIGKNESKSYTVPDTETLKIAGGKLQYLLFQAKGKNGIYPQNTENSNNETPYTDDEYRFARPICSYALNKTMTFMANCLDNYSVDYSNDGYKFSIWGDGGNRVTYNRYVDRVQETIGEAKAFELNFAFEWKYENVDGADTEKTGIINFPVVKNTDFVTCGLSGAPLMVEYYKDRTQTPLFVFALECIASKTNYEEIIIGTEFARKNNLVHDNGKGLQGLNLYTYENAVFKGNENTLPKGYKYKLEVNSVFSVEGWGMQLSAGAMLKNNGEAQPCKSWAIADDKGNIYLAVNKDLCDIYVSVANFPY